PVERNSGQKEGEDFHAFIARRNAQNEKWAAKESSDTRVKRLARVAHAAKGAPPGKKGARVFVWEEEEGFFIRKAVNRVDAADMWDEFTPSQRLYDSFSDQWDLCSAFAPEEEAGSDDDGEGYEDPFHLDLEFPEFPGIPNTLLPEEPIQKHSTANDLQRAYNLPSKYSDQLRSDFCSRSVGDETWLDSKDPKFILLPALFGYLSKAASLEDVPQELFDLRQDHADISGLWAVDVEPKSLNDQPFYIVRPSGVSEDQPLYIILQSAATSLLIVRMGWDSIPEIVYQLLARGIEFRLCFKAPLRPAPSPRDHRTGLGFRPAGYKPTNLDYRAYVTRRDEFLLSPRGRAARFAGGIIGRLARETGKDDLACLGPSDDAFETGVRLWDGRSQTAYWDNDLTSEEIDLICGVYIVATG
ncbi:hypothetical protein B0H13DRAFT_1528308, partial [Mycena leptocephala]